MRNLLNCFLLSILLLPTLVLNGQNTQIYTDEDYNYREGIELFEKKKYALAQSYFDKLINYYGNEHTEKKASAEYLSALCAINLYNNDAEYRMTNFIANYPESPLARMAYFEMGKYRYRNNKYSQAIYYFNKVWKQHLNNEQLCEFYFKLGYSYFREKQYKKASKAFYEIVNKETKYKGPAIYYYSHIAYKEGNYETALNGFKKLENDPTFSPIVPYYTIQIYYRQGKTDKVLEMGKDMLDTDNTRREAEISRLVGEALYKNKNYIEALPYLEKYKEKSDKYTREDIYQLGYTQYMNKHYAKAVETWTNMTNIDDELSQNALFLMADSYLKINKKKQARMAFQSCSKLNFNSEFKEISMLNYAKLSYELSYSPFNETLTAFFDYLSEYPKSIHRDEAYEYLTNVYLTSKNYKEALLSLDKIKIKSPDMLAAYQRVAYFRGLELYNNLQFESALAAFNMSISTKAIDREIHALALYWKAEALYRTDKYEQAANTYIKFMHSPGGYLLPEYNKTYYNLGYAYFKLKDYENAISWFRKYTDKADKVNIKKRSDALIRIADCYFVSRQYAEATNFYDQAVQLDTFDIDYAMFQKGFSQGLQKQYENKITTLSTLLNNNPNSSYSADALFERGRSYIATNNEPQALTDFEKLVNDYPNSSYVPKALLQTGLIHYNQNDNEKAVEAYKNVIKKYSGTKQAKDALLGLKNIYVDLNKVDEYFAFIKEKSPTDDVNQAEKDSLTYLSAERIYMTADWDKATKLMSHYLAENTNGKYVVNAHYYRADCYLRLQKNDSALSDFTYVVDKPKNIFTEEALLNAAKLNFEKENYSTAYNLFNKLENQAEVKANLLIARKGQMRAAYKDSNYNNAIEAAKRLLITEKIKEEDIRTAQFIMAKSYEAKQMFDLALTQYRLVAQDVKNIEGAISKYKISLILYNQGDIEKSEQEIMDFIKKRTSHQYWLGKAFILLSDIYLQKDDKFQAKANLTSLMDNYKILDDGIVEEARAKYKIIITEENRQFRKEQEEKMNN